MVRPNPSGGPRWPGARSPAKSVTLTDCGPKGHDRTMQLFARLGSLGKIKAVIEMLVDLPPAPQALIVR